MSIVLGKLYIYNMLWDAKKQQYLYIPHNIWCKIALGND